MVSEKTNPDTVITVAICSYNGARSLPDLIKALRMQYCPVAAEILVVDNNSTDDTGSVIAACARENGTPLRYVFEASQGITYARNRAIEEAVGNRFLAFIDADELPEPGWLASAVDALHNEQADCVGGVIKVKYPKNAPPAWLTDELSGFLGQLNHGDSAFWIKERSTPVWSGNIAYRTEVFRDGLRFDGRYDRHGKGVGGGSDAIMFRSLIDRKCRIRYRPDMIINHLVEPEKLRRRYFLRLHYLAGRKFGEFEMQGTAGGVFGIPPYMVMQLVRQIYKYLKMSIKRDQNKLRQAMNASYAFGALVGRVRRRMRAGMAETACKKQQ